MKILVFTSKYIGLDLLDVLFSRFNKDDYMFIVSEPNSKNIIESIEKHGHNYKLLNDATLNWLNEKEIESFDWLLNLWGSHIFSEELIAKAKKSLNIHPSMLPFGRGRDPIVWAIRYGHPAGVTLHEILPSVDKGPIIYQEEVCYDFPITGAKLYEQVIETCIKVFSKQWPILREGNFSVKPQPDGESFKSFKRIDLLDDNVINLDDNIFTKDLLLRILAHDFADDYSIQLINKEKKYSLRLLIQSTELEADNE
jgi:dTDP-4-amino-4,6-dideoxyglucose formyltransferase